MAVGLILVVISNLFTVAGPYLLKMAIDSLGQELRGDLILLYAGLIVLVALVAGIGRYFMRELLNGISRRMETDLRGNLFGHFMRLPPQFFDRWRTGDLMSRATNDVQARTMFRRFGWSPALPSCTWSTRPRWLRLRSGS
jgi:ATP-binding cassette subfamily B protein